MTPSTEQAPDASAARESAARGPSPERTFDVLMTTDLRFPGGSTASVVEEIEAQHRAGYRTGLIHLPSPVQRSRRPFAERIRKVLADGKAELVLPHESATAPVFLVRHPTLFSSVPADLPRLRVGSVVMIANQVPSDDRGAEPYYDVAGVHRTTTRALGVEPVWAPIGPLVRSALLESWSQVPMLPDDWENIIDLEAWGSPRTGLRGTVPVIGRHSRGHWSKWPDTREDLLAAYPDDPRYAVRVLGGTEAPEQILGSVPDTWATLPFDSVPVPQFLDGIDFLVYFHHPGLVEAFGRVVLEGLAAGAVCIVSPVMRPVFGDACLYGSPQDVTRIVDELAADPEEYARRSALGHEHVRRRYSYDTHLHRLAAFAGPPTGEPAPAAAAPDTGRGVLLVDAGTADEADVRAVHRHLLSTLPVPPAVSTARPEDAAPEAPATEDMSSPAPCEVGPVTPGRIALLARAHRAKQVVILGGDPAALSAGLGDDVDVFSAVRGARGAPSAQSRLPLPDGWTADPVERRRDAGPVATARRSATRAFGEARRRAPAWTRRLGRRAVDAAGRAQEIARTARRHRALDPSPVFSHVSGEAPVVLAVVGSDVVDPGPTLDALLARAQASSAFRLVVLAPARWLGPAAERGVSALALVSRESWPEPYTAGWSHYLDVRVHEVVESSAPVTTVLIEQTLAPGAEIPLLDVAVAAARR